MYIVAALNKGRWYVVLALCIKMLTFLVCLVLVAIQATADKTTPKNPGYDITPLKERVIPDQVKEVFKKKTLISANPICRRDAATLCPATSSDNLLLLPCMQSQAEVRR